MPVSSLIDVDAQLLSDISLCTRTDTRVTRTTHHPVHDERPRRYCNTLDIHELNQERVHTKSMHRTLLDYQMSMLGQGLSDHYIKAPSGLIPRQSGLKGRFIWGILEQFHTYICSQYTHVREETQASGHSSARKPEYILQNTFLVKANIFASTQSRNMSRKNERGSTDSEDSRENDHSRPP